MAKSNGSNGAQTSASDLASRKPVTGAASADVKGTHGSSVGEMLIKFLQTKAETIVKVSVSLKDKVREFYDFSDEDFEAYFNTTKAYREQIALEAAKAKLNVTQYRKAAEGVDYIYVSLSEFDRIARAVKTGWRPELRDMSWADVKMGATERLGSEAKRQEQEQVKKELAQWVADDKADPVVKQSHINILNAKMAELADTKPEAKKDEAEKPASKLSNFQQACNMLDKFPVQDLELVKAWLDAKLDKLHKAKPVVNPESKVDPVETAAPKKAAVAKTPAPERATAKADKRIVAKSRKH